MKSDNKSDRVLTFPYWRPSRDGPVPRQALVTTSVEVQYRDHGFYSFSSRPEFE
jgi:hypothetical protein